MKRSSTPIHRLKFPVDPESLDIILVTYAQNKKIILEKQKDDLVFKDNIGYIYLTQEESKLFSEGKGVCEVKALSEGGDGRDKVAISQKFYFNVEGVLNDVVLHR